MKEEFTGTVFEYEIEGYHCEDPSTLITDVQDDKTNDKFSSVLDNHIGKKVKITVEVIE